MRLVPADSPDLPAPRLVLRGAPLGPTYRRAVVVQAALLAAWIAGVVAIRRGVVPWFDGNAWAVFVPLVAGPLVALVVFLVLFRHAHAAAGEVALDDAGATILKESVPQRLRVEWPEVLGYRDGAASHVQLVAREGPGAWSSHLGVPTPTEADRVAVLAFLDARGLQRLP